MTDEQIAREFLRNVRDQRIAGVAEAVLIAIIGEARATERQKCVAELISLTNQIYQEYQGHTWVDEESAQDNDNSSASVQFALRRAIVAITQG